MRNLKLSLHPKSWKLWIIIIILIIGIVLFYITQQPSIGTVKTLSPSNIEEPQTEIESLWNKARQEFIQKAIKIGEEEGKREGFSTYSGKYISFQYPNSYNLQTKESSSSGTLEKVVLLGSVVSSRKLVVTATKMTNADSLEEISGVQARRLKPKTYQERPLDILGKKGILFEKKEGGYEKTAFSLADQILATIALTSVNKDNDLDKDFDFMVKELTLYTLKN